MCHTNQDYGMEAPQSESLTLSRMIFLRKQRIMELGLWLITIFKQLRYIKLRIYCARKITGLVLTGRSVTYITLGSDKPGLYTVQCILIFLSKQSKMEHIRIIALYKYNWPIKLSICETEHVKGLLKIRSLYLKWSKNLRSEINVLIWESSKSVRHKVKGLDAVLWYMEPKSHTYARLQKPHRHQIIFFTTLVCLLAYPTCVVESCDINKDLIIFFIMLDNKYN